MAQLSSPGVSVTVIDESFYTPSAPGTVPLIVVASGENKANSAGTGTAPGTLKANAGKVYLLTSQMDLGNTFGVPFFQTDASNNPVHAGEMNEYGLQAAYSFLGVSNRAYVVRADLDLSQLEGTTTEPSGPPADGTLWLDTTDTQFGVFEWNAASAAQVGGQTFTVQTPIVITEASKLDGGAPLSSIGVTGDYAVVVVDDSITVWHNNGTWTEVGSTDWIGSLPTATGSNGTYGASGHTLTVNTHLITNAGTTQQGMVDAINGSTALGDLGITAGLVNGYLTIYSNDVDVVIGGVGTGLTESGLTARTYKVPALTISTHTQPPQYKLSGDNRPTGSVWVKTTTPNHGADYVVKKYNAATGQWVVQQAPIYGSNLAALYGIDKVGGGANLTADSYFVRSNDLDETPNTATFRLYSRNGTGATTITSGTVPGSFPTGNVIMEVSDKGVAGYLDPVTISGFTTATQFVNAINTSFAYVKAEIVGGLIVIKHILGGDIKFTDIGTTFSDLFGNSTNVYADPNDGDMYVASLWTPATVSIQAEAPVANPADGQLWYNTTIDEVDILAHDGTTWVGYKNQFPNTDPAGPQVKAVAPKTQSDGTDLVEGDIWVSTADLENYPMIYRRVGDAATGKWVLLDNTDQTTENGVLFHDARWNTDGLTSDKATIAELLESDFLDFDAPDPALYPQGMILWNLRRSGNNILRYAEGYVNVNENNPRMDDESQENYYVNKWVSEAPNTVKGAGAFGRKSQRAVVVKALNALINENQAIRDEDSRVFNIISCPGYLETLPALNALNTDRGLLSFVISDAPARLTPDATTLSDWGNNVNGATGDGEEGLVSTDPYSAVYYPWGFTTDLNGNNIAVPPSHIMLRTFALSDNVSYEWFAPAGTRRGGVTNASSVGYVTAEGEFQTVALNTGQRDTLASIHVNPITYIGGVGLVAYGQKTRQLVASALDRINVARLVVYLRYQLNAIAKPYIFEPNDTITRNEIKQQVETLMLELTGQRALYDYLVVCDTSNNTPARIDRNELHVDIAIEPVKAVEFIYIPLRLENTGSIKGLGA